MNLRPKIKIKFLLISSSKIKQSVAEACILKLKFPQRTIGQDRTKTLLRPTEHYYRTRQSKNKNATTSIGS